MCFHYTHKKTKKTEHNLINKISEVKIITEKNGFWSAVTTVEVIFEGFGRRRRTPRTHTAGQKKCLET